MMPYDEARRILHGSKTSVRQNGNSPKWFDAQDELRPVAEILVNKSTALVEPLCVRMIFPEVVQSSTMKCCQILARGGSTRLDDLSVQVNAFL